MYYLGIDLGGTNICVGLVNESGKIIKKENTPTIVERGYEAIVKDMAMLCKKIIDDEKIDIKDVVSIGIGSPGIPDIKKGVIIFSNNLKFENVPLRDEMKKHIDLPVYIENDANCAALGESTCGAAKDYDNSVMVTLGTGIGSGIIINGKIFSGAFYGGGEMGHMVIESNGELCSCGRQGCWEMYASATALIRQTRVAAAKYPNSKIFELVNGDIKLIDAKVPFDAAQQGDEVAKDIIDRYLKYLAVGISNIINIFEPEIIAIGGGVCAQGENIIKPVTKLVKGDVYGGGKLKTKIVTAKLGNDAGVVGAAMLGK